jgi:hypothetical protein
MTASSGVVLSNLAYLIGAIVLAIIGGIVVWLYHRQPKSVDANVESFQRGLRALAPGPPGPAAARAHARKESQGPRVHSRPAVSVIGIADKPEGDEGSAGAETG